MNLEVKKILIADDDDVSLEVLGKTLEKWGHIVLRGTDGVEGLKLYEENPDIQCIISDWMMPNMDGIEFCKRVREIDGRAYTYFVLLTAKAQVGDLVEAMEAGADDFINKPLERNILKARLIAGDRVLKLQNELAERVHEISEVHDKLNEDLGAAAKTLNDMMPEEEGEFCGIKYASRFKPCDLIGGDFFNIVKLDDSNIGVYILDVSGHGVPAALLAVSVGRLLSPYDTNSGLLIRKEKPEDEGEIVSPSEVVNGLNSWFGFTETGGKFITLLYGVLNLDTGKFRFSRAGHPVPIHISNGNIMEVPETDGIPVGIIPDSEYNEAELILTSGDRLYLYTDGLPEAHDADREQFTVKRIQDILVSGSNSPLNDSISTLVQEVIEWSENKSLSDDMSIIGLEFSSR